MSKATAAKNQKSSRLTGRDEQVLDFIWKWKLATTVAIAERFYEGALVNGYNRLNHLERSGFIQYVPLDHSGRRFAWSLDQKGFRQLYPDKAALAENGYLSEAPIHDLLVSAVQLGEWIRFVPRGVEFLGEQELRRKWPTDLPKWDPKLSGRRPDGYWLIPRDGSEHIVALEVESNTKKLADYGPIGLAYRAADAIKRVIWIVETETSAIEIQRAFQKVSPEKYLRHNFVLLKDFKKQGWNATVLLGFEKDKSLRYAICMGDNTLIEVSLKLSCSFNATSILIDKKCPFKSSVYAKRRPVDFSHCMALPAYSDFYSSRKNSSAASSMNPTHMNTHLHKEEKNNE